MPIRCNVGARFNSTGWFWITSSRISQTSSSLRSSIFLGALDRVGVAKLFQSPNDERLVQFQCDLLRQAALMQTQGRTDHNHASSRIVDSLSQQVLSETALLTLDHVGQRLQRPVAAAQHGTLAAVVVEQGVDRLLQHPLFIADNHFRRVQIDQFFQPVVAVDNTTVEVVQVARREIARVQQHQRTQGRAGSPGITSRTIHSGLSSVADGLDDLQTVDQVFALSASSWSRLNRLATLERACTKSRSTSSLRIASAPMSASQVASGYWSSGGAILLLGQQLLHSSGACRPGRSPHNPGNRRPFPGWWSSSPATRPNGWASP